MRILKYESLASTNTEAANIASTLEHGDVVVCRSQTAGRGQRGNSWEAEPGKNLTFSVFLKPTGLLASESFLLSMAVSTAIANELSHWLEPEKIEIKWPNDIYWHDRKLVGILIENSFTGNNVKHSIVGVGINVNQAEFLSDAPNPVSMVQIAKHEFPLDELLESVTTAMVNASERCLLRHVAPYHKALWRREGVYHWQEPGGEPFEASIIEVKPTGQLVLDTPNGPHFYAFKEVFPVLSPL